MTPNRNLFIIIFSILSISLFAQPDADKPIYNKDQVILDDLIIDGSACVGQDCVNGESFGFDTIRLKENNLRIKFQDTSNSASFPTNDWQITINDSSNGGKNKFSIDDIDGGRTPFTIEAGAPSHSLYVEADGDVGIKTDNPVVDLHVVEGNTPTLRLEQDGSDGFTPQTWDVAGNEANFFVRDVTNGSQLPFKIKPGADSDALFIAANNNIGIGTDNPQHSLHIRKNESNLNATVETVAANGKAFFRIKSPSKEWKMGITPAGDYTVANHTDGRNSFFISGADDAATFLGDVTANMNLLTSDIRLKSNVSSYNKGLDLVLKMNPIKYDYSKSKIFKTKGELIGISAQELAKIEPLLVTTHKFTSESDLKDQEYLKIYDSSIKWILVNAIKEQQNQLRTQDQELTSLKQDILDLKDELSSIISDLQQNVEEKNIHIDVNSTVKPNPSSKNNGYISYEIDQKYKNNVISIYSVSGELIHTERLVMHKGNLNFSNINLTTGNFYYTIISGGRVLTTKSFIIH